MEYYAIFDIHGPHPDPGLGFQVSTKKIMFSNEREALLWFHDVVKVSIQQWNLNGDLSLYDYNKRITSTIV